jgi:predicted dehydrogenase
MTAPTPVALGLVGCGRLAEAGYIPAVALTPSVRIVAVADPDATRREVVAKLAGAVAFSDAASLLDSVEVDAVVLATPAAAHVGDATLAVRRGVTLLVEKPPAPDAAGAAELARLHPPPLVGLNRRFDAGFRGLRNKASPFSELRVRIELSYRRGGWGAVTVHDDVLTDLGPHVIDLARWISDSEVQAVTRAEVTAERASFELVLGRAHARVTIATDRIHHELVEVRSASGSRVVGRHEIGGFIAGIRDRLRPTTNSSLVLSLAAQLEALAVAARGGSATQLGTARDGWAVMEAIESVRASSARGGQPVAARPVPEPPEVDRAC